MSKKGTVTLLYKKSLSRFFLSAERYTGLRIRWANRFDQRLGYNQFDPEGVPAPEPGSLARLAQGVHAALFRAGG